MDTITAFLNDDFKNNKGAYDRAKAFYKEFTQTFPRNRIRNIMLDDFLLSVDDDAYNNTFCRKIRYSPLASLGDTFPASFEIYFKGGIKIVLSPTYKDFGNNYYEAFSKIKKEIEKVLDYGERCEFDLAKECKISSTFSIMLLAIYCPDLYFPAPTKKALISYCEAVNLEIDKSTSLIERNHLVVKWKNNNPITKDWDTFTLMRYTDWLWQRGIDCNGNCIDYTYPNSHFKPLKSPQKVDNNSIASIENLCHIPEVPNEEIEYIISVGEIMDEESNEYDEYVPMPETINGTVEDKSIVKYVRDPKKSAFALKRADYLCEYNVDHESFTRASNGLQYTEPHHLIPISQQGKFEYSLDVPANIVSLCSNCHNCIHYGKEKVILLKALYEERKEELEAAKILVSFEDLLKMY